MLTMLLWSCSIFWWWCKDISQINWNQSSCYKRIYTWGKNWCRGGSGLFRQSCTTTTILIAPGRNCRRGGDSRHGTDTVFRSCVRRPTGWRWTKTTFTGLKSGCTGKWRCLIKGGGQYFGCGNSIGIKLKYSWFFKACLFIAEKAHSNGPLKTFVKPRLATTKLGFAKAKAHTDLLKWSFRDLNTATSSDWSAYIVWGGKENRVFSARINYVQCHVRPLSINE